MQDTFTYRVITIIVHNSYYRFCICYYRVLCVINIRFLSPFSGRSVFVIFTLQLKTQY